MTFNFLKCLNENNFIIEDVKDGTELSFLLLVHSSFLSYSLLFSSLLIPSIQAGQTEKLIKFWFQTERTDRRDKHIVGLPWFKKLRLEVNLITDSLEVLVRLNLFQYIDLQISIKMSMWGSNSIIVFPIFVMEKYVTKIRPHTTEMEVLTR